MSQVTDLLSKINTDDKAISFDFRLTEYNIFRVLQVNAKEVIMCRFLTDLLNPEGQHECGTLFLKSFLRDVLGEDCVSDTLLAHTEVINEFVIDRDRRIDIVIQNIRFFVPIEVKIYAGEQEGQCFDYFQYAKNAPIVYLTRFGDMPSEYSRKSRDGTNILPIDQVKCISWVDICNWLLGLMTQLKEPVKSIVVQYVDAIQDVVDIEGQKMTEHTLKALYESPEYFSAGIEIERMMKLAKVKLIRLVFDDLKVEMKTVTSKYGLELETCANYYVYDSNFHDKYYDKDTTFPGLNYVVKHAKFSQEGVQMWFRIEVEYQLFAGIVLFDTKAKTREGNTAGYQLDQVTEEIFDQVAQYLDRDIILPMDNWWVTWCYSNGKHQDAYYEDVPDFKDMNPCAISLVDTEKRKEYVKNAVRTFEEHILKYLILPGGS